MPRNPANHAAYWIAPPEAEHVVSANLTETTLGHASRRIRQLMAIEDRGQRFRSVDSAVADLVQVAVAHGRRWMFAERLALAKEREREMFLEYFNLMGRTPGTLSEIGERRG